VIGGPTIAVSDLVALDELRRETGGADNGVGGQYDPAAFCDVANRAAERYTKRELGAGAQLAYVSFIPRYSHNQGAVIGMS
jgi:hypothetical protein